MRRIEWFFWVIMSAVLIGTLSGCAGYNREEDGTYSSWGFLRTLEVKEVWYENGQLKERTIVTHSNTGEVLSGINEVLGTTVGAARDAMP